MGEQDDPALDNVVESIIDALETMATDDPAAAASLTETLSTLEENKPRMAERDREERAGESEYEPAESDYTVMERYSDEDEDEGQAGARYESSGRARLPAIKRVMDLSVPVAQNLPGG